MTKEYRIRILTFEGGVPQPWVEETIEVTNFSRSSSGYYEFKCSDGTSKYYPIKNTIVEEL